LVRVPVGWHHAGGQAPRQLGLRMPTGHRITPSEISTVNRAIIRFEG
jgi:hypothetical protein